MSFIVYGPQGCGKTTYAKALMKHLGLKHLIDDGEDEDGCSWHLGNKIPEDTLILINEKIDGALDFFEVKAAMELASASA